MTAKQWEIYLALIAAVLAGVAATTLVAWVHGRITAGRDHTDCRELRRLSRWLIRFGYVGILGRDAEALATYDPVGSALTIIRIMDRRHTSQRADPQPQPRYRGRHWDETVPVSGPTPPAVGRILSTQPTQEIPRPAARRGQ